MQPVVDAGPPAHLYVHVPFCLDRCTYCAFATVSDDPSRHDALVQTLHVEHSGGPATAPLKTLYIGGGTPSRLSDVRLERLVTGLTARSPLDAGAEVTLEANPTDIRPARLEAWRALGITRISLGVQTFRSDVLRRLGRHHDGDDARSALRALEQWPGTWSADLIVGWGGQTVADAVADVESLVAHAPPHVSVYGLTVEPGTPLARTAARDVGDPELSPDLDDAWSSTLERHGYHRYETSNFAREGHRSRHNQAYWRNDDVLGLGPGAVSTHGPLRWTNIASTTRYVAGVRTGRSVRASCERLSPGAKLLETLAVGLRTADGVDMRALDRRFSGWRARIADLLAGCVERGWWIVEGDRLRVPDPLRVRVDRLMEELVLPLVDALDDPFDR